MSLHGRVQLSASYGYKCKNTLTLQPDTQPHDTTASACPAAPPASHPAHQRRKPARPGQSIQGYCYAADADVSINTYVKLLTYMYIILSTCMHIAK
jgi:hypothetical protein